MMFYCFLQASQSALAPAGPQSGRIAELWWFLFWVSVVVWLAVMAVLLTTLIQKYSATAEDEPKTTRVVGAAVAVTVVTLFVILVLSAVTGRGMASAPDNEMNVNVTGHQWWWELEYTDGAPNERVTTANELHIPVGRPVRIHVTSHDVIHSFWVPNLHGKMDLIPSVQNTTWFQADKPGIYRGQCAEFCGLEHAKMAFYVIADPPEKFYGWLNQQRQSSAIPADDLQQRGRQVFLGAPCILCHSIRGTDAHGTEGPDLTHLASRETIAAGSLQNTPGNLGGWVTDARRLKPGNHMPSIQLKADDVQPLIAYLGSLK
jgi:cytochrome c oxidase subunit II